MLFKIKKDGKGIPQLIETSALTEQGWKEKHLENYLRENLVHLISDDLMVISQSRPFKPEADLLALDQNSFSTQTIDTNHELKNSCWKENTRSLTAINRLKSIALEQNPKFCSVQIRKELLQLELRHRRNAISHGVTTIPDAM